MASASEPKLILSDSTKRLLRRCYRSIGPFRCWVEHWNKHGGQRETYCERLGAQSVFDQCVSKWAAKLYLEGEKVLCRK